MSMEPLPHAGTPDELCGPARCRMQKMPRSWGIRRVRLQAWFCSILLNRLHGIRASVTSFIKWE